MRHIYGDVSTLSQIIPLASAYKITIIEFTSLLIVIIAVNSFAFRIFIHKQTASLATITIGGTLLFLRTISPSFFLHSIFLEIIFFSSGYLLLTRKSSIYLIFMCISAWLLILINPQSILLISVGAFSLLLTEDVKKASIWKVIIVGILLLLPIGFLFVKGFTFPIIKGDIQFLPFVAITVPLLLLILSPIRKVIRPLTLLPKALKTQNTPIIFFTINTIGYIAIFYIVKLITGNTNEINLIHFAFLLPIALIFIFQDAIQYSHKHRESIAIIFLTLTSAFAIFDTIRENKYSLTTLHKELIDNINKETQYTNKIFIKKDDSLSLLNFVDGINVLNAQGISISEVQNAMQYKKFIFLWKIDKTTRLPKITQKYRLVLRQHEATLHSPFYGKGKKMFKWQKSPELKIQFYSFSPTLSI
ncbi:MAG: hypothetical protein ACI9CD_001264 [Candidatus Deianiraeaceae bacterium]|jgi:hypothetical protein